MKTSSIFDRILRTGKTSSKKKAPAAKGSGKAPKRVVDQVKRDLAQLDKIPDLVKETKRRLLSGVSSMRLECTPKITKKAAKAKKPAKSGKASAPRKPRPPAALAGVWPMMALPAIGQSTVPVAAAPRRPVAKKAAAKAKKPANQLGLGIDSKVYKCKRCRFKTSDLGDFRLHVLKAHQ